MLNFGYGLSEDEDAYRIVDKALRWPQEGFLPSRTWGFPAYEMVVYPLLVGVGAWAAKLWSTANLLGALTALWNLLRVVEVPKLQRSWASLSFVVAPVVVSSGNSVMETSQALHVSMWGMYSLFNYIKTPSLTWAATCGLTLGLATSSRMESILLSVAALAVVVGWTKRSWSYLLGPAVYVLGSIGPYLLYAEYHVPVGAVTADPVWRTMARAALGPIALFGVPFFLVLMPVLVLYRDRLQDILHQPLGWLWLGCMTLYGVRFALLPDELEYILILLPLSLVVLASWSLPSRVWGAFFGSLLIPNLIQFHLFKQSPEGRLLLQPGLSAGALAQERGVRLRNAYVRGPLRAASQAQADALGFASFAGDATDREGALVILARPRLALYQPQRRGGRFHEVRCGQTVFVYDMPAHRGWRKFIAYEPFEPEPSFQRYRFDGCPPSSKD